MKPASMPCSFLPWIAVASVSSTSTCRRLPGGRKISARSDAAVMRNTACDGSRLRAALTVKDLPLDEAPLMDRLTGLLVSRATPASRTARVTRVSPITPAAASAASAQARMSGSCARSEHDGPGPVALGLAFLVGQVEEVRDAIGVGRLLSCCRLLRRPPLQRPRQDAASVRLSLAQRSCYGGTERRHREHVGLGRHRAEVIARAVGAALRIEQVHRIGSGVADPCQGVAHRFRRRREHRLRLAAPCSRPLPRATARDWAASSASWAAHGATSAGASEQMVEGVGKSCRS